MADAQPTPTTSRSSADEGSRARAPIDLSSNPEEERYLALQQKRAADRRLRDPENLGEVEASDFQVRRTRPVRVHNLGGGLAERRRENQQREADTRDTLRRLKRPASENLTVGGGGMAQRKREAEQNDASGRATLERFVRSPNEAAAEESGQDVRRGVNADPRKMVRIRNADGTTQKVPSAAFDQTPQLGHRAPSQQEVPVGMAERMRRMMGRAPSKTQKESVDLSERLRRLIGRPPRRKIPPRAAAPQMAATSAFDAKKMVGGAIIKSSWATLWLTFGHSVYVLDILFFAGWASKYLRQYIPEVGREWFPGELGERIPAHSLLPLKLGEITALVLITLLVMFLDFLLLGAIAFIVGALMDAGRAVDLLPFI